MATRYTGRLSLRTLVALACALPFALLFARPAGAQAVYDPMADARSNPALVVYANLGAEKAKGEDLLLGAWERTNANTPVWANFADAPGQFTGGLTSTAGQFQTAHWFAAGLIPRRDVTLGLWVKATTDWSAWTANGLLQVGSSGPYSDFLRLRRASTTQFQIQYPRFINGGRSLTSANFNFPAGAGPPLAGEWRKFDIVITAAGAITAYVNGLPAVQTTTPLASFGEGARAGACFEGGATVLFDAISGARNPNAVVSDFAVLAGCHIPGQPEPAPKLNRLTVLSGQTPAGVALRGAHLGFVGVGASYQSAATTRALTGGFGWTRRDKILLASPLEFAPFPGSVPGPTPGSPWNWDTRVLERTLAFAAAEALYIHIDVDGVPARLQDPAGTVTPYFAPEQMADTQRLSNSALFADSVPNDGTNTGTLANGDVVISDSTAEAWAYAACDQVLLIRAWCTANGVDPSRVSFGFWNEGNTPYFWRTGKGYQDPKGALYKLWKHWIVKMRTLDPTFPAETLSTTGTDRTWIGDFLRRAQADGLAGAISAVQVHGYQGLPTEYPAAAARAVAAECDAAGVPRLPVEIGADCRTMAFPGASPQYPTLSPPYDFNANAVGAAYLGTTLIACARSVERTGIPISAYTFVKCVAFNDLNANPKQDVFGSTGLLTPDLTRLATANVYDLFSRCTLDTDPTNQPRHAVTVWEGARQMESLATLWSSGSLLRPLVAVPGTAPDRVLAFRLQLSSAFDRWSVHLFRVDDLHASARNGANASLVSENAGVLDTSGGTDLTVRGASVTLIELTPPGNQAPTANDQSVTINEDMVKTITLTGSDPENDPLTYSLVTQPQHGALTGTAPKLTYKPAANYNGSDSFTFKVNDGTGDSNVATVSITINPVNDRPNAKPQNLTTTYQTAKAITLVGTDVDGDPLTYTVTAQPLHGSLTGTVPDVTYTPEAGFAGLDSFKFKVNDGKLDSPEATVSIHVTIALTGLKVTGITRTGATVSWTTDAPSDSTVEYGTTSAYGQTASVPGLVTSHVVTLSGLAPATRYFVRVTSASAGGAIARATTSFTTAP
jgi:hypothetical protein